MSKERNATTSPLSDELKLVWENAAKAAQKRAAAQYHRANRAERFAVQPSGIQRVARILQTSG